MRDGWAPWQRDYAHGTFVLWPDGRSRAALDALRQRYDPASQATCGAHITLTQPLRRRLDDADRARIEAVVAAQEPFTLTLGPLDSFLPAPVLFLRVTPPEPVLTLRRALHDLGLFRLDLPHTEGFVPHLTVTEGRSGPPVTRALYDAVAAEAPTGALEVTAITWIVPDDDFHFEPALHLPLRSPGATAPSPSTSR